jgi:hypothetical protein
MNFDQKAFLPSSAGLTPDEQRERLSAERDRIHAERTGITVKISEAKMERVRLAQSPDGDQRASFLLFLVCNLVAAYVPGVFWWLSSPADSASPWLVPVFFLLVSASPLFLCAVYAAFLLLIAGLSAHCYRLRSAWVILPGVLFLSSLIQGGLIVFLAQGFRMNG